MCWSPAEEIRMEWPPYFFSEIIIDPFSVPLVKTIILLSSGVTITAAHFFIIVREKKRKKKLGIFFLILTVILGFIFLYLQLLEYRERVLSFKRTVYGSSFFILTGFHGLHVTIGALALRVILIRYF